MEKNIDIKIPKIDCPCKRCVWALDTPNLINCGKYKLKPSDVLYESAKCPKFEANEFDPDDDEEEDYDY